MKHLHQFMEAGLAQDKQGRGRRRRVLIFLMAFLIFLTLASFLGDRGLPRLYRLYKTRADLEAEIVRLKGVTSALEQEVASLERDPERIERIAREELGLVRPGEVVYQFGRRGPLRQPLSGRRD